MMLLLIISLFFYFFFFFQAEDGIRDVAVTGVQTCALPISLLLGCRTASPCDRRIGLDMDLASLGRETRKFLEQDFCISELIAARPSQLEIAVDGLHQHDCTSSGQGRSEEHTSELQSRLHLV